MKKIKYLTIRFKNEISFHELRQFRGAVIEAAGQENVLFHNHQNEGFRYAYPLIQYKRVRGKPVIVCLNEGTEQIHALFQHRLRSLQLGDRTIEFEVESIDIDEWRFELNPTFHLYRINNWLALNVENYHRYRDITDKTDKHGFLAKILRGNLLSMAKGLNWHIEQEVLVSLHDISHPRVLSYKDAKLTAFDAYFSSNISLPYYIGLGKGSARGFGTIYPKSKNRNPKYEERDNLLGSTSA